MTDERFLIDGGFSHEVGPHTVVTEPGAMKDLAPREPVSDRTFRLIIAGLVLMILTVVVIALMAAESYVTAHGGR